MTQLEETLAKILDTLHAIEREEKVRSEQLRDLTALLRRAGGAIAMIIGTYPFEDD